MLQNIYMEKPSIFFTDLELHSICKILVYCFDDFYGRKEFLLEILMWKNIKGPRQACSMLLHIKTKCCMKYRSPIFLSVLEIAYTTVFSSPLNLNRTVDFGVIIQRSPLYTIQYPSS